MKKLVSLLLALTLMVSVACTGIVTAATSAPTIIEAVAINDTQFKITTSEAVTVKNAGCFALFVAKNGVVPNLNERDGRFGGTISPSNTAATEFIWTINANGNATQTIQAALTAGHKVYFGLNGALNAGAVDPTRAADAQGNGFAPNLAVNHTHAIYAVEVNAFGPNIVKSVTLLNDYRLEIEFTKPLASFAGAVLFGILDTAGTGLYNSDPNSVLDDHAVMAYEIKNGKMECWLSNDKSGMSDDGKNISKFMAAVASAYPNHKAGIALLEANVDSLKNTGVLEQATADDGTPLKGTGAMSGRDICAAVITVKENAPTAMDIQSVSVIDDYRLQIVFSKPLASFAGAVLFGILDTAKTGIYNSDPNSALDDHAVMAYEIKDGKLECWLSSDKSGMSDDGKNITKFMAAVAAAYSDHKAGIALLEANNADITNTGVLEQVTAADGSPLKGTATMSGRDICAAEIGGSYQSVTLTSATRISDSSIKITFSKDVTIVSDGGGLGIVARNGEGKVLFDAEHPDMRYGGTVDKTSGREFIWTIDGAVKRSVTDILLDWQAKGYTVAFCSNSGGSQDPIGYNSRITDTDGNPLLAPVATQHTATAILYYALCDITNSAVTTVEIETAVAVDDFRFEIKFDKPVKVNNKGCAALMAYDENGKLLFEANEHQGIAGGTLTETSGTDMNDTWTWTINNGLGTATDVIRVWETLGYTVVVSVNGDAGCTAGTLVNNRVTDGIYSCLKANDYNGRTKQNCHTIAVSALDDSEDIVIDSVVYSGTSQLIVTFSESVEIDKPGFIGLRIVDKNGNYVPPIDGTLGSQHNMVWSYVKGSNQTQIVLTFHSKHMLAMLNLEGFYAPYAKDGNHTVFMIGEKTTNVRNGYIDDVVGLDGSGVLKATYAHLVYQELNMQEVTKDTREPLTVVSATAISDTDIVIKFSAPVEIGYSPFICLRVVDPTNKQVFAENDTRLQYYGTWKFADEAHDTIIWTSNNWNVKGLLSLTGPWARFNKDGNVTRLCIEELEDKNKEEIDVVGNGFIDNVVDARGMMLLANSIAGTLDTYDGLYVDVAEDYQEPAFYLKSAAWTGDKQITLTFNKPVYFDEKPFMAIRFVNEANALQYDGKDPLQYQGSWVYGNEEKTVLIWTATYGGSVTAIMTRTAQFSKYPDYKIMFCIEEIPADKKVGDLEDGTIHNIYTDDGTKLYANVVGAATGWDGVYVPISAEYTPKDPSASKKPEMNITMPEKEEPDELPAISGPISDLIAVALHSNKESVLPWIALGLGGAVFIGVLVILVAVSAKKKDE